jgi:hypothetical protein
VIELRLQVVEPPVVEPAAEMSSASVAEPRIS